MGSEVVKLLKNIYFAGISGIFCVFALSILGFLINISINPFYSVISLFLAFLLFIYFSKKDGISNRKIALLSAFMLIGIIFLGLISYIFIDISYDGRSYHQGAAVFLKMGWNPFYSNIYEFSQKINCSAFESSFWHINDKLYVNSLLWIEHYTKFFEIFAANIYSLTGKIETGEILNYLMWVLTAFYAYATFCKISCASGKKPGKLEIFSSFLVSFTPVTICQCATYCVDGLLYFAFINVLLSIVNISLNNPKNAKTLPIASDIISVIMNLVILANVKIAGLAYGILILFVWFLYLLFIKKFSFILKRFLPLFFTFILLAGISGINPYYTNIKQGKHILYPLAGEGKVDVMTGQMPESFRGKNRFYKLFMSTFARAKNVWPPEPNVHLKVPFSVVGQKLFTNPDMRISGFGYFWSGILIFTAVLLCFLRFKNKESEKIFILLMAEIFSLLLINPESWWARYVPWFWTFPLFVCYFSILEGRKKKFAYIILLLMLLNNLIIFTHNFLRTAHMTYLTDISLMKFKKGETIKLYVKPWGNMRTNTYDESFYIKLQERGIDYKFVTEEEYRQGCFEYAVWSIDKKLTVECKK